MEMLLAHIEQKTIYKALDTMTAVADYLLNEGVLLEKLDVYSIIEDFQTDKALAALLDDKELIEALLEEFNTCMLPAIRQGFPVENAYFMAK